MAKPCVERRGRTAEFVDRRERGLYFLSFALEHLEQFSLSMYSSRSLHRGSCICAPLEEEREARQPRRVPVEGGVWVEGGGVEGGGVEGGGVRGGVEGGGGAREGAGYNIHILT